jgi:putative membrane protein
MADGRPYLGVYLRGVCMGAADAVPGVSGGTIALLTGIYERLIAAITAVETDRIRRVLAGVLPGRRGDAATAFLEMDGVFLTVLAAGVATAVITISRLLEGAMEHYPVVTFGFFFGLIAASAWVLRSQVVVDTWGRRGAAIAGFVFAFVVSGQAEGALGHSPVVVFVAGSVAVSAMILPGISGSLILLLLGQYEFMVERLRMFIDALPGLLDGTAPAGFTDLAVTIAAFVTGAFVGLFTVSHVVKWALAHRHEATMAFLIALIVGALRAPVVQAAQTLDAGWTVTIVVSFLAAALVGSVAVLGLERAAGDVTVTA